MKSGRACPGPGPRPRCGGAAPVGPRNHDLHGLLAEGPLPRRVQVVGLVGQLQDDVVRLGIPELREHGGLEVPGRLGVREPLALPGQGDVEVADGQALGALVGP